MKNYANLIRTFLGFTQALIDGLICWLSFYLVMAFWLADKYPAGFSSDIIAFFAGTTLAVFYFNGLYDFRNWVFWDEVKTVLKSAALIFLAIVLYLYSRKFDLSGFVLAAGILFFVPVCLTVRYVVRRIFFASGLLVTHIVVIGAGKTGELFAQKISAHPFTACKVIGFLDDDESKKGKVIAGFPVLGCIKDFEKVNVKYHVEEAAVAISTASRSLLTHILDIIEFKVRQVHYIPDMYMLTTFSASMRDVDGIPVISASQGLLNPLNRTVKVFLDKAGAAAALVMFSPVMLWAAYRIKREDGGEVLSVQDKVGWKGKHFGVYNFRINRLNDDRRAGLTRIGTLLKKNRLYELPQLFNVLKGDMSLVGPRPLTQRKVDFAYGDYAARKIYAVKPGITSFWQVSERKDRKMEMRKEVNLYYIRNWSLWLDIVILLKTVTVYAA